MMYYVSFSYSKRKSGQKDFQEGKKWFFFVTGFGKKRDFFEFFWRIFFIRAEKFFFLKQQLENLFHERSRHVETFRVRRSIRSSTVTSAVGVLHCPTAVISFYQWKHTSSRFWD